LADRVNQLECIVSELLKDVEHYGPQKPHEGPCGPMFNCDGDCMEYAQFCERMEKIRAVIANCIIKGKA